MRPPVLDTTVKVQRKHLSELGGGQGRFWMGGAGAVPKRRLNPVRVSPQLSTPFLSLESNPWRKSEPQHPAHTRHLSVQTASWLRSAGQLWFLTEFSLLCLARTCCCAPLWGSVSPSCPCPWGSFQVYRNFSTFTALSPRCLFCLFIFLLPI